MRRRTIDRPQDVLAAGSSLELHDVTTTRQLENEQAAGPSLMERAGLAVARLALATAPEARTITVAVGPGNNGGDGLVAARHLHRLGKKVSAVLTRSGGDMPADARAAFDAAVEAGVPLGHVTWPADPPSLVIDALVGIGARGEPRGALAQVWRSAQGCPAPRLAVDVPSGLDADHGTCPAWPALAARDTLSLLTLKPGLFTGKGRDACGRIWFDDLGIGGEGLVPVARLVGATSPAEPPAGAHADHKGSFGDVIVVGGAQGMQGALVLAARAALGAGAGRVYVVPLVAGGHDVLIAAEPALMPREQGWLLDRESVRTSTVICGCGGGSDVAAVLPALLSSAPRLVIDADGLNAIAADASLLALLQRRATRGMATVVTPHPLEAARLADLADARAVQDDRLGSARGLARALGAVVVLKGAGTIIDDGSSTPWINASGNALLATAGTGDVLAGRIGGSWSRARLSTQQPAALATLVARCVRDHGRAADQAAHEGRLTLSASALIDRLSRR